jgi:hypothetical protein
MEYGSMDLYCKVIWIYKEALVLVFKNDFEIK